MCCAVWLSDTSPLLSPPLSSPPPFPPHLEVGEGPSEDMAYTSDEEFLLPPVAAAVRGDEAGQTSKRAGFVFGTPGGNRRSSSSCSSSRSSSSSSRALPIEFDI